jgi:SAM-dependent methyltransferase
VDRQQIFTTYNKEYARTYDRKFNLSAHYRPAKEFELGLIGGLLEGREGWLDVACGTGWTLSRFPGVPRAGLDLSEPMLAIAREANPDALFFRQGDFTDEIPEWRRRWDLVTCLWYAYGIVETVAGVERVIANLAAWTSARGALFVPICDPEKLGRGIRVPYLHRGIAFPPGTMRVTGVTWTWEEPTGERHVNVVAPPIDHMMSVFRRHFDSVELVDYPPRRWWRTRRIRWLERRRNKGIVATSPKLAPSTSG